MKQIKELFELYVSLEPLIKQRAIEKLDFIIQGGNFDRIKLEPQYNSLEVVFSGYSCGDWSESVTLTIEELLMPDDDYNMHVEQIKEKRRKEKEDKENKNKELELERERKKYEELKKKFEE